MQYFDYNQEYSYICPEMDWQKTTTVALPRYEYYDKCSYTRVEMNRKVITLNVFYVQLLKVGSCTNDASIQMVLFAESVAFGKNTRFW